MMLMFFPHCHFAASCSISCSALSPWRGQGPRRPHTVLAERHKAPGIKVAVPTEQRQVWGCLCSVRRGHAGPVGCPPWHLPLLQHPEQSAALSPKMPPAHVSHVPIVFSPLQVLHFPVRAMYSLAGANQYTPGPLSYKMPTSLKRGWGYRPSDLFWLC